MATIMKDLDIPSRKLLVDTRTVTLLKPTEAMWEAMRSAELGWPLWGEDPNVNRLEEMMTQMTGKEAAMFLPTTNIANLLATMGHCQRGDQAIMEARCHLWWVEERNIATHTGAVPRLIRGNKFAEMALEDIEASILEQGYSYRPRTALVCLENAHLIAGGVTLTPQYISQVSQLAHGHGAAVFMDGAHIFNSAVAQGVNLRALTEPVDAVSMSLNKGLGAPYGSMLCGSKEFIERSRANHRILGSHSVHKEGMFAAAAIVALDTMIDRLAEDHQRARRLAELLSPLPGLSIDMETVQTNILRVEVTCTDPFTFAQRVLDRGAGVSVNDQKSVKFITHHQIHDKDVETVAEIVKDALTTI